MRWSSLVFSLFVVAAVARGQDPALRHVHPERDAEVPVSGWPTWIENLTIGSPVADHGSHAGVKAALQTDAPMHARSFLGAAHYSGFQAVAGQVDQSFLFVVEGQAEATVDGEPATLHAGDAVRAVDAELMSVSSAAGAEVLVWAMATGLGGS